MNEHFYNGFIKRAQDYGLSVVEAERLIKVAIIAPGQPIRPRRQAVTPNAGTNAGTNATPTFAPVSPGISKPMLATPHIEAPELPENVGAIKTPTPWTSQKNPRPPAQLAPEERQAIVGRRQAAGIS